METDNTAIGKNFHIGLFILVLRIMICVHHDYKRFKKRHGGIPKTLMSYVRMCLPYVSYIHQPSNFGEF